MRRELMIAAATLRAKAAVAGYRLEQGRFSRSIFADKERNVRRYLDVDTMRERADVERIATWIDTLRNCRDTLRNGAETFGATRFLRMPMNERILPFVRFGD